MFYREYLKKQGLVNWTLFAILVICILIHFVQSAKFNSLFSGKNIKETSSIIRNFAYILAIILAGAWSYYTIVVKKRTFHPRLKISIKIKDFCGANNNVAIVRFTVKNIGNVKIFPLRGKASFQYGTLKNDEVMFSHKGEIEDIFAYYHEIDENLYLEPDDEVNIDHSFVCSDIRNQEQNDVHMLSVRAEFWAARNRAYQEIALLNIS